MCCQGGDSEARRIGAGLFRLVLIAVALLFAAILYLPFIFSQP